MLKKLNPALAFLLPVFFLLPFERLGAQQKSASVELFPRRQLFRRLLADPQEVHLGARLLLQRNEFGGSIGYSVGLVQLLVAGMPLQVRLEGSAFLVSKVRTPDFPVQSTDYTAGLPVQIKINALIVKAKIAHISSHLGDNFNGIDDVETAIDAFGNEEGLFSVPKKFSKEFLELLASTESRGLRFYGGFIWDFHRVNNVSDVDKPAPLTAHYGAEKWFGRKNNWLEPYLAIDVKQKQEFGWHVDWNLQMGFAVQNHHFQRMRTGFEIYRGFSNQGQFFRRKESDLNLFVMFDF